MWEQRKQPNTAAGPATVPSRPNGTVQQPRAAVIGRDTLIIGKVSSSEDLYVDGEIRGTLEVENSRLTIGPHGRATAGAKAREVDLHGRIDGNVETLGKISIRKGGQLVGDIRAAGIVIEDGAYFKGNIDIVNRPQEAPSQNGNHGD